MTGEDTREAAGDGEARGEQSDVPGDGAVGSGDGAPTRANLARRLAAVERAVTDRAEESVTDRAEESVTDRAEGSVTDRAERASTDGGEGSGSVGLTASERLERVDERLATLERRVGELEAATEAVRGYVGGVRAVNRRVERRADAALAAVARLDPDVTGADEDDRDADGTPDPQPPWWAEESAGTTDSHAADTAGETGGDADCPRLAERGP